VDAGLVAEGSRAFVAAKNGVEFMARSAARLVGFSNLRLVPTHCIGWLDRLVLSMCVGFPHGHEMF